MSKRIQMSEGFEIIALHAQNLSLTDISDRVEHHKSTVSRFLRKYFTKGSTGRVKGSGRNKITTPAEDRLITRISLRDRLKTAEDFRREFNGGRESRISTRSVRRRLAGGGLCASRPAKKPYLTQRMRIKRVEWTKKYKNWTIADCKRVILSVESKFNLFSSEGMAHSLLRPGERYSGECMVPKTRNSASRIVWGCFSYHGTSSLTFIDGKLNGDGRIKVLQEKLVPFIEDTYSCQNEVIFQDDSPPCRRSKILSIELIHFAYHSIEFLEEEDLHQKLGTAALD